MLVIPARNVLHYLQQLAGNPRRSADEQVVLTNFVEDSWRAKAYAVGADSFEFWRTLGRNEISLFCYLVCEYNLDARPRLRSVYGRTVGQLSNQDWWMMRRGVTGNLLDEANAQQLDPDGVRVPQPSRAAILIGSCHRQIRGIYVFHRSLSNLEGLVLLNQALQCRRRGIPPHEVFPDETVH